LIAQASTLGAISSKEIQMILGDSIAKLSIENQKTYKMFEDQYKSGNISLSSYIEESSKVFSKQGVKDGKVDSALEGLRLFQRIRQTEKVKKMLTKTVESTDLTLCPMPTKLKDLLTLSYTHT
jgi:hypothetical protein